MNTRELAPDILSIVFAEIFKNHNEYYFDASYLRCRDYFKFTICVKVNRGDRDAPGNCIIFIRTSDSWRTSGKKFVYDAPLINHDTFKEVSQYILNNNLLIAGDITEDHFFTAEKILFDKLVKEKEDKIQAEINIKLKQKYKDYVWPEGVLGIWDEEYKSYYHKTNEVFNDFLSLFCGWNTITKNLHTVDSELICNPKTADLLDLEHSQKEVSND